MPRKKFSLYCALTLLVIASAVGGTVVALRHEPSFYTQCVLAATPERKVQSETFTRQFIQMLADIRTDRGKWGQKFSQDEINSFFAEDFERLGEAENLRKLNIDAPRIVLEDQRLRFAFRYGTGFWSTVVSYDLRLWLVPKEPNVLAVEILNRRIGAVPVSTHALLNEVTELARRHNMEVSLYRHEGHPVALIRLWADRSRPTTNLDCLKISPAELTVAGASPDLNAEPGPLPKAVTPSGN